MAVQPIREKSKIEAMKKILRAQRFEGRAIVYAWAQYPSADQRLAFFSH